MKYCLIHFLYYFFAPPFTGLEYSKPAEGSYLIVNKNLIEACALWVLFMFPSSDIIGLDRFFKEQINKGDEHE